jgi:hypothetical protein
MRRVTAILSMAAIVLMAADLMAQGKPSFAGEWKIAGDMHGGGGRGGGPGIDLTITQDAAAITLQYRSDGQAAPAKLAYKIDGSVSKNVVAGRAAAAPTEQVSRAVWAGNNLVVTTTTGAGEEKRTFSLAGGNLVVETAVPARFFGSPNVTRTTYRKYERGFGG